MESEVDCRMEERRSYEVLEVERVVDLGRAMRWNLRRWKRGSESGIRSRRLSLSKRPLHRLMSAQCANDMKKEMCVSWCLEE